MGQPALPAEIAARLGGAAVLGTVVRSSADLALLVRRRLPLTTLEGIARSGVTEAEIDRLIIPPRTRRYRAAKAQPLTVEESHRAVRILRVQALAERTFGDRDKAGRWLRHTLSELGGESPLALAATEAGARVVEGILAQIAWGAAA